MAQHPIEMILLKQWASLIAVPVWITDADGRLVYYNEPTEEIIGMRFEDAGEMSADQLAEVFVICDIDGSPLATDERPLMIALTKQLSAHRRIRFLRFDKQWREIAVTAIPIIGEGNRHLGAMVTMWEDGE
ncbi:MAG TPA: PAS domain-containing protein [Acidimicrobiia bacterium]|nr:PAS domain-containing protein [Acidimicrobiia bacterium]